MKGAGGGGGGVCAQAKQAAATRPAHRRRALRIIEGSPRQVFGDERFCPARVQAKLTRSIMRVLFYPIQRFLAVWEEWLPHGKHALRVSSTDPIRRHVARRIEARVVVEEAIGRQR